MIRARLETRHFTFEAFGVYKSDALAVLKNGWNVHRRQYGGSARVAPFSEFADGVEYSEVEVGQAYRDGQLLK